MKVVNRSRVKNRSPDCKVVKRRGRLYVICKSTLILKQYKSNRGLCFLRAAIKSPQIIWLIFDRLFASYASKQARWVARRK